MARQPQRKDAIVPDKSPAEVLPARGEETTSVAEPQPERGSRWWIVAFVWVGALLLLWGTELVSFVARLFASAP